MILPAGSPQRHVIPRIENYLRLGQHSIVLDFSLSDGRAVVGEDNELGLTTPQGVEGRLVAEGVASALNDQC